MAKNSLDITHRLQAYAFVLRSLLRVPTYILICTYLVVGFLTGMVATGSSQIDGMALYQVLLGFVVIALWYIQAAALNDYADYEIDLVNLKGDPDRPLVNGMANKNELVVISVITSVAALALAASLSLEHFILIGLLLVFNAVYSLPPLRISYRGAIAPLVLPIGYTVLPFCFGYFFQHIPFVPLATVLLTVLYAQFVGRIILKDYRDVKGDLAHGKRTFLVRYGNSSVCIVAAFAITLSAIIALMAAQYVVVLRVTIIALTTFGLIVLWLLAHTHQWKQQKPLLSAFGRSMTGITAAIIVGLAATLWNIPPAAIIGASIMIIGVYMWSAKETYHYTEALLAKKEN